MVTMGGLDMKGMGQVLGTRQSGVAKIQMGKHPNLCVGGRIKLAKRQLLKIAVCS